jgi:hypothetical protein
VGQYIASRLTDELRHSTNLDVNPFQSEEGVAIERGYCSFQEQWFEVHIDLEERGIQMEFR